MKPANATPYNYINYFKNNVCHIGYDSVYKKINTRPNANKDKMLTQSIKGFAYIKQNIIQ